MEPVRDPEERQRQSQCAADMPSGKSNSLVSDPALDSPTAGYKSSDSVIAPSDVTDDSMVTVPLSGPPSLAIDTTSLPSPRPSIPSSSLGRSVETIGQVEPDAGNKSGGAAPEGTGDVTPKDEKPRTLEDELKDREREDAAGREQDTPTPPDRDSGDSVNWDELQKTEHEQKRESDTSTHLLLARLDQENAKPTSPSTIRSEASDREIPPPPPSMAQLKKMVHGPTPQALRYSMLPPPPMTDLEFFAALVKDYQQTAERLPTLLSNKIRKGIPPPLRGVVWQSISGARDAALAERYDQLANESSPYEFIISKDLARSFPGVEMFRERGGEGQRMLGRVLKSFSIYDREVGYCQGLAFLVGPLLMHMPDKAAFCVLVRLMERYDLRSCFQPDLAGLHVRIYQFRELLRHNQPGLSTHLDDLQVDPAYVSQWFLSFFAVTCPLPMLFRIYDVLLAEGATETFMRVGLALMQRNASRLLACTELEDAMQILLSRGIWDTYNFDADAMVNDVTALTPAVSGERLQQLELSYKESKRTAPAPAAPPVQDGPVGPGGVRTSEAVNVAASRFLGRNVPSQKSTLSPGLGPASTPAGVLRRSTSKQSLASTLNSMEASSASVASSTSTEATSVSRDSGNSSGNRSPTSLAGNTHGASSRGGSTVVSGSTERPALPRLISRQDREGERNLHTQIEDLLTALSELQRNQALLASQLKQERNEREEDKEVVRSLVRGLGENGIISGAGGDVKALLQTVESRFGVRAGDVDVAPAAPNRAQLNEDLARTKEKLNAALDEARQYSRRIYDLDQEMSTLRQSVKEGHAHARSLHQDKQRLEKQMQSMRSRSSGASGGYGGQGGEEARERTRGSGASGLREFKLGRAETAPQPPSSPGFNKRSSSLRPGDPGSGGLPGDDSLLRELVQAKTAEAVARQEAEEYRGRLEALRRAYGLGPSGPAGEGGVQPAPGIVVSAAGAGAAAGGGIFGKLTGEGGGGNATASTNGGGGGGGFWGWRR